jgi:AraC-like DNA-binding protein
MPEDSRAIYVVLRGVWQFESSVRAEPLRISRGDVLVMFGSQRHLLRPIVPTQEHPKDARSNALLSVPIEFADRAGHPLWSSLPSFVLVRAGQIPTPPLFRTALDALRTEADCRTIGGDFTFSRLCEILAVQALRIHLWEIDGRELGWLRVLADLQLRPALEGFHAARGKRWTVTQLADQVNRSRSRLSSRFSAMAGFSARSFLSRSRIAEAMVLLESGQASLAAIADATGFGSTRALCRAFRRETGTTPAAYWRKLHALAFPRRRRMQEQFTAQRRPATETQLTPPAIAPSKG